MCNCLTGFETQKEKRETYLARIQEANLGNLKMHLVIQILVEREARRRRLKQFPYL